jgi:hypothetical protein
MKFSYPFPYLTLSSFLEGMGGYKYIIFPNLTSSTQILLAPNLPLRGGDDLDSHAHIADGSRRGVGKERKSERCGV